MIANSPTMIVPLQADDQGVIYVSNTHITLETVIARHQQGDTPESILTGFPTLSLTDIYAVIAYYLAHSDEIDSYLKQRDEEMERRRQAVEASYTPEQQARAQDFKTLLAQKGQNR